MKKVLLKSTFLCICLAIQAFSQSSNARVSGTVNDTTGAVLPGVEVTATNNCNGSRRNSADERRRSIQLCQPSARHLCHQRITSCLPDTDLQRRAIGNAAQVRLNLPSKSARWPQPSR